ncbi:MAG TPA: hypothetical protein VGI22_18975 [Xanthobacteraceae bacterium]|jgi:hypothetical protein
MSDEAPDPQKLLRLVRQTMSSAERRQKYSKIDFMDLSYWHRAQLETHSVPRGAVGAAVVDRPAGCG